MFCSQLYTITDEGSRCIFSELCLHRSSSADCQHLHTVSAICSYTAKFIIVPPIYVSICFVLFISRRYQRLALYSVEYDCWTTKGTRFIRHEVLSAVFWVFKISCFSYCVDWLVIKLTDVSKSTMFPCWQSTSPKWFFFAVLIRCNIKALEISVYQCKFPDDSDVHSWLTEDSDLTILWRKWIKITDQCCQGCPQSSRQ